VNTVYFDVSEGGAFPGADVDKLVDDTIAAFRAVNGLAFKSFLGKAYRLSDAKPRFPISVREPAPGADNATGPHEVALCLSYFAGQNRPRTRGRIYLGPFTAASVSAERPNQFLITNCLNLGRALADVGGVNVDWNMRSVKDNALRKITGIWVDDEWDTQRSRGLRATSRQTASVQ